MFHSLVACTGFVHHYVYAKIMKIIQEERILHGPRAIHFVSLIKYILRSIVKLFNLSIFFFTARHFVAALAVPMLVLYSEPKNLLKSFIYGKKSINLLKHNDIYICRTAALTPDATF